MRNWNGRTILRKEVDIVIESDASLEGWGASCMQQWTGGPWSVQEKEMHINCLELLAATLAVQSFLKDKLGVHALLKLDNTTAVAYINHQGGTVSKTLVMLTRNLWMWCLERNISIVAEHVPGALNQIADEESRIIRDRSDWMLDPKVFHRIDQLYGPIQIDLFASRLTTQCPRFFSWRPDPFALATDAFLQDWTTCKGFANPPWCLIGQTLAHTRSQQARVVLLAPVWMSQPWYPTLLGMLSDYPTLLPEGVQGPTQATDMPICPQLAIWPISGRDSDARNFQKRLQALFSAHGGSRQTNRMTPCLGNGIAGVLDGVQIPFRAL